MARSSIKPKFLENKYKKAKFTFIDLFAGMGGMRIAFEKAGGKCVFSSENDKYPAKLYADNFGRKPAGDITKIKAEDIPSHDMLVAGFPCQPFSNAGVSKRNSLERTHGFECKEGRLFFEITRILKHHKTKMFLLENVKGLLSHNKGQTFQVMLKELEDLGYRVTYEVLNSALVVPQRRERLFIVGILDSEIPFEFPKIRPVKTSLGDIFEENIDERYTISDQLWKTLKRRQKEHKENNSGFGYNLVTAEDKAKTLSARYSKDGAEILVHQEGKNPRLLSPRECARLMGFPDKYEFTVSDTRVYKCLGNAVVIPLVMQIAKKMFKTMS
jgi:DNA (cytosine-5)-methyltransferase 1